MFGAVVTMVIVAVDAILLCTEAVHYTMGDQLLSPWPYVSNHLTNSKPVSVLKPPPTAPGKVWVYIYFILNPNCPGITGNPTFRR